LTLLDQHDRFVRREIPDEIKRRDRTPISELFLILDRPPVQQPADGEWKPDELTVIWGQVSILTQDGDDANSPVALVTGRKGERLSEVISLFEEIAGNEVDRRGTEDGENDADDGEIVIDLIQPELADLLVRPYYPPQMPPNVQRRMEQEHSDQFLQQTWPTTPLPALGGKTPREAADDPELRVPLAAAVHVLDAYCDGIRLRLDLNDILKRLNLEPPRPISVDEQTPLTSFSIMQSHRVPVESLTDSQLMHCLNRALLVRHDRYLYCVLKELTSRPNCCERVEMPRVYTTLIELCQRQNQIDEALHWVQKGREYSSQSPKKQPFGGQLEWDTWEMMLRIYHPDDPKLRPLMQRIWQRYGAKVEGVRPVLETAARQLGIAPPWESEGGIVTPQSAADASGPSGVWTPEGAADAPGGEKKLWIPGQD